MKADKQKNKHPTPTWLEPYKFQPGVSGNPKGRPPGPTLKEWVRSKLIEMDEEERIKFLKGVPRDVVWRMAEGNPHSTQDTKVEGELTISGVDLTIRK